MESFGQRCYILILLCKGSLLLTDALIHDLENIKEMHEPAVDKIQAFFNLLASLGSSFITNKDISQVIRLNTIASFRNGCYTATRVRQDKSTISYNIHLEG